MNKKLLTTLVAAGVLCLTAQAQTTPASTTAKPVTRPSKTSQGNSGDTAPNRSSTAGNPTAGTSNNPVDATGKPVGTSQSTTTSPGKTRKPKN
ncbi:MAG: hypothetical protein EOO60_08955 [Hymenobacter sp.]|nr:MAG: hypothetical protein EOO60_08955 [Hymenobacter sp.]